MADDDWGDVAEAGVKTLSLGDDEEDAELTRLQEAVEKDPKDAENQYLLGQAYLANNMEDDAVDALKAATKLKPTAKYFHALGVASKNNDDRKGAEEAFTEAVKADPKNADSLFELGQLETDAAKSLEFYRKAIAADMSHAGANFAAGLILQSNGSAAELKEAAQVFAKARDVDPANDQHHARLVQALDSIGSSADRDAAMKAMEEAFTGGKLSDTYLQVGRYCCGQFEAGDKFVMAFDYHKLDDKKTKYEFVVYKKGEVADDKILYTVSLAGNTLSADSKEVASFDATPSYDDVKKKVIEHVSK